MAGTATDFNIAKIHQGAADLWIIGGGVVDSATPQLTIATDGTPDATAHPLSIHLGSFEDAAVVTVQPKWDDITIDQTDGVVARFVPEVKLGIEVTLKQLDPSIMQYCAGVGTYATASGYKQITYGGLPASSITDYCVALIAKKRAVAGKYLVAILFKAQGVAGISTPIGKSKSTSYKAQFMGLDDMSRTAGRRQGVFYETN